MTFHCKLCFKNFKGKPLRLQMRRCWPTIHGPRYASAITVSKECCNRCEKMFSMVISRILGVVDKESEYTYEEILKK